MAEHPEVMDELRGKLVEQRKAENARMGAPALAADGEARLRKKRVGVSVETVASGRVRRASLLLRIPPSWCASLAVFAPIEDAADDATAGTA